MNLFMPQTAYIDPKALKYKEGKKIKENIISLGIPVIDSKQVIINYPSLAENYFRSKRTILLTVSNQKKLASCKPSADYQFSLSSSCPGNCEYCYLQTTQGEKPFIKLFVNIKDILQIIQSHINNKSPNITTFECSSITDPIALEHLTGNLKTVIEFFGKTDNGRLRLVTKYNNVDSLLNINHNKHTTFRFSINSRYVLNSFEHNTSSYEERIGAASKIGRSNYPLGFIIAPIMIYDSWKKEYKELLENLHLSLKDYKGTLSFELIQHRFTLTVKELISKRFPCTKLDMDENKRLLKWGPYGKFKYVYTKEQSDKIKTYISDLIKNYFSSYKIEYFT